ncbi:cobalamin biosynthesis protein [Tritonibacter mobilis]|uniref:cobalamin biosynthesis protein n=1 Tax=Tritonibacter mobilis TaxID=379347 RepID=UPI001CD988F4|nr:cobalamin biosynthesis protein [Tritonibacter mobilis]MCA2006321.1 cobalamin biosynthesis protein [Tritonibacter mobilis]
MMIAGFGFSNRATEASLAEAYNALKTRPDRVVTLRAKADSPVFRAFALAQNLTVETLDEDLIAGVATPTLSPRIHARFNTGSVAEACALVAAGAGARLIQRRCVTTDGLATVALAEMIER